MQSVCVQYLWTCLSLTHTSTGYAPLLLHPPPPKKITQQTPKRIKYTVCLTIMSADGEENEFIANCLQPLHYL
jgi:hypothetical protein